VTLVSKRWRRLFYAEPSLWRRFTLRPPAGADADAAWQPTKNAQLARVAGLVAELDVFDLSTAAGAGDPAAAARWDVSNPQWGLAAFLRLLPRDNLTVLHITVNRQQISEHLAAAALGFPQLLTLELGLVQLPRNVAALLRQLPRLQRFVYHSGPLPAAVVDSLLQLSTLTSLELHSAEPLPPLQQLTRLTSLRSLKLSEHDERAEGEALEPPAPAALPCLESFHFHSISEDHAGLQERHWLAGYRLGFLRPRSWLPADCAPPLWPRACRWRARACACAASQTSSMARS
jgi:hypothetical protein